MGEWQGASNAKGLSPARLPFQIVRRAVLEGLSQVGDLDVRAAVEVGDGAGDARRGEYGHSCGQWEPMRSKAPFISDWQASSRRQYARSSLLVHPGVAGRGQSLGEAEAGVWDRPGSTLTQVGCPPRIRCGPGGEARHTPGAVPPHGGQSGPAEGRRYGSGTSPPPAQAAAPSGRVAVPAHLQGFMAHTSMKLRCPTPGKMVTSSLRGWRRTSSTSGLELEAARIQKEGHDDYGPGGSLLGPGVDHLMHPMGLHVGMRVGRVEGTLRQQVLPGGEAPWPSVDSLLSGTSHSVMPGQDGGAAAGPAWTYPIRGGPTMQIYAPRRPGDSGPASHALWPFTSAKSGAAGASPDVGTRERGEAFLPGEDA